VAPSDWDKVQALFDSASALPATDRQSFLESSGADEPVLREVRSLLAVASDSVSFLEKPVLELHEALPAALADEGTVPDALLGTDLAGYRVLRRLGTGGMGVVYLARQRRPEREVALKVIRPGFATARLLRRFEHEAEALARLHHPGVVPIYEAGTATTALGVQPFFAMELVQGEQLLDHATRQGLSLEARVALLTRVCDAVQHAHSKGVVHRDLKPANILVEANGQPRILDFGVARLAAREGSWAGTGWEADQTEAGALVGTLAYMSPEQLSTGNAHHAFDTRSDVYALGVIAYRLLSGEPPHDMDGLALHEAAKVVCERDPVRPSTHARPLRGDLDTVVLKALERDPGRRYQSAAALGDDLQRVLLRQPIHARPASAAYQLGRLVSRHRVVSSLAGAMVVLLAAFGVWMSVLYARAEGLRRDAEAAWSAEHTAREDAQQAQRLATRRAETTASMLNVLTDAFRSVDPALTRSEDVNARDLVAREIVDRGIGAIERRLKDEPDARSQLLAILATTLGGLGKFERATDVLDEAVRVRRTFGAGPDLLTADYLSTRGLYLSRMGREEEARATISEALEMYRALGRGSSPQAAAALGELAFLHISAGRMDEAERLYAESIGAHERTPGHAQPLVAISLNGLARGLSERGEYDAAERTLRRALVLLELDKGDPQRVGGSIRHNIAWVLCMSGRFEEAERVCRQCLEERRVEFPAGHARIGVPLMTLGLILTRTGRAQEAEPMLREALEIRRAAMPEAGPAVGEVESALGECLAAQGRTDEAGPLLLSGFAQLRTGSDTSFETSQLALARLAAFYAGTGDETKASEYRAMLRPPWAASAGVGGR
jgi:tetratricopeptide (TPR) repeat protein/predicted Ser/Thr protein kinase